MKSETKHVREFTCSRCKITFTAGWTEEEAIAEREKDFPDTPQEQCVRVCEECYNKIMRAWRTRNN